MVDQPGPRISGLIAAELPVLARTPGCFLRRGPPAAQGLGVGVDQLGLRQERGHTPGFAVPSFGVGGNEEIAGTPEVEGTPRVIADPLPRGNAEHPCHLGGDGHQTRFEEERVVVELQDALRRAVFEFQREPVERVQRRAIPGDELAEPVRRAFLAKRRGQPVGHPVDPERAGRRLGALGGRDLQRGRRRNLEIGLGHGPDQPAIGQGQVGGHQQQGRRARKPGPPRRQADQGKPRPEDDSPLRQRPLGRRPRAADVGGAVRRVGRNPAAQDGNGPVAGAHGQSQPDQARD